MLTEGRKETSLLVSPNVCVVDVGLTNSQVPGSDSVRNWTDSILTVLQRCGIVLLYSDMVISELLQRSCHGVCRQIKGLGCL